MCVTLSSPEPADCVTVSSFGRGNNRGQESARKIVSQMEDPRCTIAAVELDDPRGAWLLRGVTIEIEDPRYTNLGDRAVLRMEDPRCSRVTMKMEDPRCGSFFATW